MNADVQLAGPQVRVTAWDLVLDASDRRTIDGGDRRALVHDAGDALTINWGSDYPGGVRCHGDVHFPSGNVRVDHGRLEVLSVTRAGDHPIATDELRVSDQLVVTKRIDLSKPAGASIRRIVPGKLKRPQAPQSTGTVSTQSAEGDTTNMIPIDLSVLGFGEMSDVDDLAAAYSLPESGEIGVEIDVGTVMLQLLDRVIELGKEVRELRAKAEG